MMTTYVPSIHQLIVEVHVRDIARSTAFYRRLGFELVRDAGTFVELAWEGHLFFLEQREIEQPPYPQANVRVMVADVDRYWALTQEMGARVILPIADREYGLRDFTIADPDGFGIRFGTRMG